MGKGRTILEPFHPGFAYSTMSTDDSTSGVCLTSCVPLVESGETPGWLGQIHEFHPSGTSV